MTYRKLSLRPLNVLLSQALASRMLKRAVLGAGALAPAFALANPTGGQVVSGMAGITTPDSNHTVINQASQSAIINWQQFSIGSNQYVQFIQPDSSSVVLNRVVGGNPSQILGNLSANGQVFLVNPNGVFFGQTATLDVQGLIATTLDIKDSDFLAGHYVFGKGATAPDASVVNQGTINANGGYVVLAGDYVENDGTINAQTGQVVLAAGNQMTLTLNNNSLVSFVVDQATLAQYAGVNNVGTIAADGGEVLMTAKVANALTATAVNNSGLVTAHSIQDHNGVIVLAAQGGDIVESGTLDASATQSDVAGGAVVIRGDRRTEIASTASINAAGDNANGGFVELSGHHLSVRGNVNLGHGGNLLIDPMKLYITSGGLSHGSWTSGDWVTAAFIDTQLNAGVSLTLVASNSVTAAIPPGALPSAAAATNIAATNASGNLTIKTGSLQIHSNSTGGSLAAGGYCNQGVCTPYVSGPTAYAFTPTNGAINLGGLTINIAGAFTANVGTGNVALGAVTAKQITVTAGSITTGNLNATGLAASQGISLTASHASYGGAANINTGTLTTTAGNILITQKHGKGNPAGSGGNVILGAISGGGALTITTSEGATGSSHGGEVKIGGLAKAKSISITTNAKQSGNISAQSFHATGSAGTGNVTLSATNTNTPSSGGEINVTGVGGIIADNGAINLATKGGLDVGGSINVPYAITAGNGITIGATNIGTLSGAHVNLGNVTGKFVHISVNGLSPVITAGAITANGLAASDNVTISLFNAAGTASAAGGAITLSGNAKSSHGSVMLNAGKKAGVTLSGTAGISAAGLVTIQGKGISVAGAITGKQVTIAGNASGAAGSLVLHNVTATGAGASNGINISGQNNARAAEQITTGTLTTNKGNVSLGLAGVNGGGITVSGAIKSGGSVTLYGSGVTNGFKVTGSLSGAGNVSIYETGNIGGSNALKTGNIVAGGYANISVQQNTGASKVTLGNISAVGGVGVTDTDNGTGSATLTVGNVSATDINISAHATVTGQTAAVTVGSLSAVNNVARAEVSVIANGKNATINTGAITAQGVLSPFSGHPTSANQFYRGAAVVNLNTSGSGAGAVNVNGAITLAGTGKHYAYTGTGSHTYTASGSTGQALLSINAGTGGVTVTGAITETGMGDVGAQINAGTVSLGGSVDMTATAGKMKESGTYVSGSKNITYSESGAAVGGADLFVHDANGATVGNVSLSGPAARMFVQGGGAVTTGAVTLNASGEQFTHKASGTDSLGKAVSYSSTESAGNAVMLLQAGTRTNLKSVNVNGAVTVSGAGKAVVNVQGSTVATQGISVTEAAGKYSRTGQLPTGVFSAGANVNGVDPLAPLSSDHSAGGSGNQGLFGLTQGTLKGGIAGVQLQGVTSGSSCGCQPLAASITVGGNISVSAVGEGQVSLNGSSIRITGGITGVATRATVNGKGSHNFMSSGKNYSVAHTVSGSGGVMHVDIRGKQNGTSGGSSNNYSGTAVIGGAISLTGPTASVEIKSGSVTTGNITVTGSGENITVKDVYTPSGTGSTFTLERSGVISWTGIDLEGKSGTGTVKTGNLSATGPLFAAIHIGAGNVSVGSLDVTASSGSVTLLDTRVSSTPLSFTAGDAGIAISNISGTSSAPVFSPATVSGNVNMKAARDAHLLSDMNVSGYVLVTAGRNIDDPLPTDIKRFLNLDPHNHGGSSSKDISTLKLSTSALALLAGGNIRLNDAVLKVGSGTVPGVAGDSGAMALLATQGLASTGMLPNATFVAGGTLGLGTMTLTGNYLYMEAGNYNLTGPVSVPASAVVQFAPTILAGTIGIEPGTSTTAQLNLNGSLLNLFPGTTLLVGGTGVSGDVTIGATGAITLGGGSNFFVDTTGTVTGLDNILSTGLVGNLLQLLDFQVPTAGEIQNTSTTSGDDPLNDQKKKQTTTTGSGDGSGNGGTIETDDSPASVCRG